MQNLVNTDLNPSPSYTESDESIDGSDNEYDNESSG